MAAGRFVLGMGSEPLIVAITTALAKWFKGKELSFAIALNLTFAGSGPWRPTIRQLGVNRFTGCSRRCCWPRPSARGRGAGRFYFLLERHAERAYGLATRARSTASRSETPEVRPVVLVDRGLCVTFYSAVFPSAASPTSSSPTPRRVAGNRRMAQRPSCRSRPWWHAAVRPAADRIGKRALLMAVGRPSSCHVPPARPHGASIYLRSRCSASLLAHSGRDVASWPTSSTRSASVPRTP